jgi:hypothetical protein
MRALHYTLADGTVVKTYAEAQNSGQKFQSTMVEIPEPFHCAPVQKEMLDKGLCPIVGVNW